VRAVRNRKIHSAGVEDCFYRHAVARHGDIETATCGFIEEFLGQSSDGTSVVERGVCESCRASFPPSAHSPNPIVASVLFARASRLADSLPAGDEADRLRSLAERAGRWLDVMYARPVSIEPASAAENLRALAEMVPPPALRHGRPVKSWAIGVTTAPRIQPVLATCLDSLGRAGWKRPHLFIDSAVNVPAPHDRLPCTFRDERVGAWANYYLSLAELLHCHPQADAYMVVQDDALFYDCESLAAYLETVFWPGKSACMVSLYCSKADTAATPGWHSNDRLMQSGPLALAFPRELASAFLTDREVFEHRWQRDELAATSIGDVISLWAYKRSIPVWLPTPSLVQHVGDTSTIWPMARAMGKRQARWFAGRMKDEG
jgi:hypothetical protein